MLALQRRKADKLRVKGILYRFKALRKDEVVYLGAGGQELTAPVSEIGVKEIARLAGISLESMDDHRRLLQLATFYIYEGALKEARMALTSLEKDDVDWLHNSAVKAQMKRMDPSFSEKALGFKSFSDFLRSRTDVVELDESSTTRMVRLKSAH